MNEQQLGETPCTVDLSASTLPEQASAEVFTTTIDSNTVSYTHLTLPTNREV